MKTEVKTANKQINQDKKQLVFAPASPILTNYFLPIIWALVAKESHAVVETKK
jgi:hypothetical protein